LVYTKFSVTPTDHVILYESKKLLGRKTGIVPVIMEIEEMNTMRKNLINIVSLSE